MWRNHRSFVRYAGVITMAIFVAAAAGAIENPNAAAMKQIAAHPTNNSAKNAAVEGEGRAFTSPLVVSSAEWRNDGLDMDGFFFAFSRGGWRSEGSLVFMRAPVYVKAGVTITEFWVTVDDSDDANDVTINLVQLDNYSGAIETIATVTSSGDGGVQNLNVRSLSKLTDDAHSYYLTASSQSTSIYVDQARIWF